MHYVHGCLAVATALLTAQPRSPRTVPIFVCAVDEDSALEDFLSEPHPRVSAHDVSVVVSEAEKRSGELGDATLDAVALKFAEYGVVRLCGAWDAQPTLVNQVVASLDSNYEACMSLLTAQTGLTADDSFGYRQMVHRSSGRYDMLLEEGVAPRPLPRELRHAVLGADDRATSVDDATGDITSKGAGAEGAQWRRQVLRRLLGVDYKVEFTAALLARNGCALQDPHADGAHPRETASASTSDGASAPLLLPPHALQLFLPLCEMDVAAGPTEFWPTSHRPEFAPFASLLPSLPLEATPGDAILFDFRVVHRGTVNVARQWRPILYQSCTTSWFQDDFNFPAASLLDEDWPNAGLGADGAAGGARGEDMPQWKQDEAAERPRVGGRRRTGGFV